MLRKQPSTAPPPVGWRDMGSPRDTMASSGPAFSRAAWALTEQVRQRGDFPKVMKQFAG